jgi:class 3 adenylate cyclase/tetratricopeptide (TPR) repeat protein
MKFSEVTAQTLAWLQREGRVSYRALKLEFDLNDDVLDALKEEIIEAKRLAIDENGKVLVWVGASPVPSSKFQVPSQDAELRTLNPELSPVSYTPPHLAERIRAEQAALEARGSTDGERKTITALFADLKGSTALIEGLDPEEARAIIDPALQLMMDAVHRYEGYVAQALGDGIFALFGAPLAHEDHPQRALYAALRMQDEMQRYADTLRVKGYPPLLMRIGVNTGEVVLRSIRKDDLHADYVPVGHSTNLAARMEQLAAPGSILVTAYTHKLTDGYFAFKDLGQTQIKGVEAPLNVYEVLGAGPLRTRLQVAARRGLTRFVGRQHELEQIRKALGLIRHVLPQPEADLYRLLSSLQHFPEIEYLFKHALTQEVAYNSVLLERRKVLHEQTAHAIEQLYHARVEEHYSELAHHYSRSGNTQKAVEYLQLAGEQAVQRSANTEAITHLTSALELLTTLPGTVARDRQELTLQITRGAALMATKGYAALEVETAYARARELCQQLEDTTQLFPVLRGLLHFHLNRGELQTARELGEQLLSLTQARQDSALLLQAHYTLALTFFCLGEIVSSLKHAEQEAKSKESGVRSKKHAFGSLKHTGCYPRSTTGLPKGLIRKICKKRRRS